MKTLTYDSKNYASLITYNAASQTTALTVGHNLSGGIPWNENYTYDPATGLLTNQKVQASNSGTPTLDLSYDYLKYGTSVGRTGQLTKIVNNKDLTKSKYYDYDALGRLKTAYSFTNGNNPMTTSQWTQSYTYDRFGNRTGVTKTGTIAYTDGLAALSFTDGAGKVRTNRITTAGYTYDEAGNVTRGQSDGGVWQRYQYDAAGRLACTKDDSNVLLADYTYGASNQRLKQTEYGSGGTTCYYAWDGNSIIAEFNDTGSALAWSKSYVFLSGRLLATPTPSGATYHHPDRLGTRLITNETGGTMTAEQVTLPYGTGLDAESIGMPSNRRFTSYDRSQKTKLDYAVNRFYSACQGRFTQVDPIGMNAVNLENPQSLNLYAYVGNDPINRIDPTGLFWGWLANAFKWVLRVAGIAAAVAVGLALTWGISAIVIFGKTFALWQVALMSAGALASSFGLGKLGAVLGGVAGAAASTVNFRTPKIFGASVGAVGSYVTSFQDSDVATIKMPTEPAYRSYWEYLKAIAKQKLPRINYVKSIVGAINVVRGAIMASRGTALLIQSAPLAVTGVAAAPESGGVSLVLAIPSAIGAKETIGGSFLIRRGIRQVREGWNDPSLGHFQNLLGLLPFGGNFDDPGELSGSISRIRKLPWWEKIGEAFTW